MVAEAVQIADAWEALLDKLERLLGKRPADVNGVLFLVGIQELGKGGKLFSKEQKQDLLHIATCKVLSMEGFYSFIGRDDAGWPHWKLEKPLPKLGIEKQEIFLKQHILLYFEKEIYL
jgi:hypothetical protein